MEKAVVILGFDTEDDSQGIPLLFCFVHPGGNYAARDRVKALEWLSDFGKEQKRKGATVQAWATNLEYDLLNLFGPERIRECSLMFGRSYLVSARWRGIEFRDTIRHLPLSVASLGEMVGLKKLERKVTSEAYCLRDAAITYRAAVFLARTYRGIGADPKLTLASTALNYWRTRYWKEDIFRPDPEIWKAGLDAYHGGRTEAFALGEFRGVEAIDAASMYPWAMLQGPLPLPWGPWRRVHADSEPKPHGVYFGVFFWPVKAGRPPLPVRTADGTVYPAGTFKGWYVGEEIILFRSLGGTVRILKGYEFLLTVDPFRSYVRRFFKAKQRAKGGRRTLFKLLLNSLYGKFGQKGDRIGCTPLETFLARRSAPLDYRIWNGLCLYKIASDPPPWSNMIWPAFITARARMRLAVEMGRVTHLGGKVLYCDTDSVIYCGRSLKYPAHVDIPGRFEKRGTFTRALIVGKKEYGLESKGGSWEIHVKGVPKSERETYLKTGEARFMLPAKLRESARRGLTPNVWTERTKKRRTNYEDRTRDPAGFLDPVVVTLPDRGK